MLNYFKAFSVFFIWAFIALTVHFFINSPIINSKTSNKEAFTLKNKTISHFVTHNNKDTLFTFNEVFKIKENSSVILNLDSFNSLLNSLKSYLNKHYKEELVITGFYSEKEKNSFKTINLGKLRANKLKAYFLNYTIANYQIKTFGETKKNLLKNTNKKTGIALNIKNISNKTLDSIHHIISNKRIYVDFKDDKIILNDSIKTYTALLKQYIKEHPNKSIYITGHTDNIGYYQNNLIVGLNRANLVRNYFKQNGMENTKIITSSKGESEPIADKNTIKGKAINRRIEIKIN